MFSKKTQRIFKKLKDFLKNSRKKLKTQGKNSSYRRFPPHVIPGKTPKKKPGLCARTHLLENGYAREKGRNNKEIISQIIKKQQSESEDTSNNATGDTRSSSPCLLLYGVIPTISKFSFICRAQPNISSPIAFFTE